MERVEVGPPWPGTPWQDTPWQDTPWHSLSNLAMKPSHQVKDVRLPVQLQRAMAAEAEAAREARAKVGGRKGGENGEGKGEGEEAMYPR